MQTCLLGSSFPERRNVRVAAMARAAPYCASRPGESCNTFDARLALLWENNLPVDLNSLLPANSPWYLLIPGGINNAGDIAVTALNLEDQRGSRRRSITGVRNRLSGARRGQAHPCYQEPHFNSSNGSTGFESKRMTATKGWSQPALGGITVVFSVHRFLPRGPAS